MKTPATPATNLSIVTGKAPEAEDESDPPSAAPAPAAVAAAARAGAVVLATDDELFKYGNVVLVVVSRYMFEAGQPLHVPMGSS